MVRAPIAPSGGRSATKIADKPEPVFRFYAGQEASRKVKLGDLVRTPTPTQTLRTMWGLGTLAVSLVACAEPCAVGWVFCSAQNQCVRSQAECTAPDTGAGGTAISVRQLAFVDPPISHGLGDPLPAIEIKVVDGPRGPLAINFDASIGLRLLSPAGPLPLNEQTDVTRVPDAGIARFFSLRINWPGTYQLEAHTDGLQTITSTTFDVTAPESTTPHLRFLGPPPVAITAGIPFAGEVRVGVFDALGRLDTTSQAILELRLVDPRRAATFSGERLRVGAEGGIARFTRFALTPLGTGYQLLATSSGAFVATSTTTFDVRAPGIATQLRFVPETTSLRSGDGVSEISVVAVDDAGREDPSFEGLVHFETTPGFTLGAPTTIELKKGRSTVDWIEIHGPNGQNIVRGVSSSLRPGRLAVDITGADRFVAPDGTDEKNDCTDSNQPCQSIRATLATKVQCGDTLFIRDVRLQSEERVPYREFVSLFQNCTAERPLFLRAWPGFPPPRLESPVFNAMHQTPVLVSGTHITLDGFEIVGLGPEAIVLAGAGPLCLLNSHIEAERTAVTLKEGRNFVIEGNRIDGSSRQSKVGIEITTAAKDIQLRWNIIQGHSEAGILIRGQTVTIDGNTLYANGSAGNPAVLLQTFFPSLHRIRNNIFAQNGGFGLRFAPEVEHLPPEIQHNLFFENEAPCSSNLSSVCGAGKDGNQHVDPQFLSTTDFDLSSESPAISAGDACIGAPQGPCRINIGAWDIDRPTLHNSEPIVP